MPLNRLNAMRGPRWTSGFLLSTTLVCGLLAADGAQSVAQSAPAAPDVYVLGLYEGPAQKDGKVTVRVAVRDRPVALFLVAYHSIEWQIELTPGVQLDHIYLSGYHQQRVSGVAPKVPVSSMSYDDGNRRYLYAYDDSQCSTLTAGASRLSMGRVRGSLCQYLGAAFVIDGEGIRAAPQREVSSVSRPEPSAPAVFAPASRGATVYPLSSGAGSITSDDLERYRTIAVPALVPAPGAPQSGVATAGYLSTQLALRGFAVVERSRMDRVVEEQRLQLMRGDDAAEAIKVGKLAGAKAVAIGEVTQWATRQMSEPGGRSSQESVVSITVKLVDVETAEVLFTGEGHFETPFPATPEGAAQSIIRAIVTRLAVQVGLASTGRTGFSWTLQPSSKRSRLLVTEFDSASPAYEAGLRSGDMILSCNGEGSQAWKTQWDVMKACQVEAGQTLSLDVVRGARQLRIQILADTRFKDQHSQSPSR